jgi:hypothetical protein
MGVWCGCEAATDENEELGCVEVFVRWGSRREEKVTGGKVNGGSGL